MSTRTKTYIAFDGDSDLMSYRTVQSWSANQALSFNLNDAHDINTARDDSLPQSIINQLRERLDNTKILILLVGDRTKYNRKGILKYELQYALRNKLPILLTFIGFEAAHSNTSELWNRYLRAELHACIAQRIRALPAPYRDVVWLRYIQDYSYAEIVQELAMPIGTVKTWLYRARHLLRDDLCRQDVWAM